MKNKMFTFFVLLFLSWNVSATTITFDLSNSSGNTWTANYSIINDTLAGPIEEFTIFFDLGLYENINSVSTPANWDPIAIQPDVGIPDDGFYDALALISGIANGATLSGFIVSFDWLGVDSPISQYFEIVDPFTFDVLDSGQTQISQLVSVAEPGSISLLIAGLFGLFFARKNKASCKRL